MQSYFKGIHCAFAPNHPATPAQQQHSSSTSPASPAAHTSMSQNLPTVDSTSQQLKLHDPAGPSVWEAAVQYQDNIPASEWEYMMRKNLRDAAFTTLNYLPACTHMPVCAAGKCSAPTFVWVSRARLGRSSKERQHEAGCQADCLLQRSRVVGSAGLCTGGSAGIFLGPAQGGTWREGGESICEPVATALPALSVLFLFAEEEVKVEKAAAPLPELFDRCDGNPSCRPVHQQSARFPLFRFVKNQTQGKRFLAQPISRPRTPHSSWLVGPENSLCSPCKSIHNV